MICKASVNRQQMQAEGANKNKIFEKNEVVLCEHKGHYYNARV
jgi:uncharacterized protein YkuJ